MMIQSLSILTFFFNPKLCFSVLNRLDWDKLQYLREGAWVSPMYEAVRAGGGTPEESIIPVGTGYAGLCNVVYEENQGNRSIMTEKICHRQHFSGSLIKCMCLDFKEQQALIPDTQIPYYYRHENRSR